MKNNLYKEEKIYLKIKMRMLKWQKQDQFLNLGQRGTILKEF